MNKKYNLIIVFLTTIFLIIFTALNVNQVPSDISATYTTHNSKDLTICSTYHFEHTFIFIAEDSGYLHLQTASSSIGLKIRIYIELLPYSNSSISFNATTLPGGIWSPTQENFTLAPGESYGPIIYTLINTSGTVIYSYLEYTLFLVLPGTNATVHWWYDVLKWNTNEIITINTFTALGLIILVTIVAMIRMKKNI